MRQDMRDKKIVLCTGSFDLVHAGHALFFEECKRYGDILVVGVGRDREIKKYKGPTRPVLNEQIRMKMIDSLKAVDYVILTDEAPPDASWLYPIETIFRSLKPDVYVVNSDVKDADERKTLAEKYNVKMVLAERTCPPEFEKISTTGIIEKILKEGNKSATI